MKYKVFLLTSVMFAGLLFSASPSFAVDSFTIKSVTVGDNSVGISFNHAERSDKYTIRRNNTVLETGSLETSGNGSMRIPQNHSNRVSFQNGDTIEVTMSNSKDRDVVRTYTISGGNTTQNNQSNQNNNQSSSRGGSINGYYLPIDAPNNVGNNTITNQTTTNQNINQGSNGLMTEIKFDKPEIVSGRGKQAVNVTFNNGYVPKAGDFILVRALGANNVQLKTEEHAIPNANNVSLKIELDPSTETQNYQFIFVAGEASNRGSARAILKVSDGKNQILELSKKVAYTNILNQMDFTLKNKEGKVVALDFIPTEVNLVATNHEGHTILLSDVTINTSQMNTTGKGNIIFKTTEKGILNLRISAKDANGNSYVSHPAPLVAKEDDRIIMTIGANTVKVGDKTKTIDAAPEVKSNRTFVPLRALVESFQGSTIKYTKDKKIVIASDGTDIELSPNSVNYKVNNAIRAMDVKPYITTNTRTMVPVRFIAEALGYTVTFEKIDGRQAVVFEKEVKSTPNAG